MRRLWWLSDFLIVVDPVDEPVRRLRQHCTPSPSPLATRLKLRYGPRGGGAR